jgi:hypothetical protein
LFGDGGEMKAPNPAVDGETRASARTPVHQSIGFHYLGHASVAQQFGAAGGDVRALESLNEGEGHLLIVQSNGTQRITQ